MSERLELKELERRAYRSFFRDGIWDIYLGLLLLAVGSGPGLATVGAPPLWAGMGGLALAALAMLLFVGGKRYLTVPRLGTVRFGPGRSARRRKTTVVLAVSVLVGAALLVVRLAAPARLPALGGIPAAVVIFAASCIIVFGLAAYYLDFARLYLYGPLYGAAFPFAVAVHGLADVPQSFLAAYGLTAAPMLVIGLVLLIRFLREYPLPRHRPANDGA